ncbi:Thioredoxin domain protein [uncultured archaeon]|nr:Thioredoxin domain protein [uncultured archaeon]
MKKEKSSNFNTYLIVIVVIAIAVGLYFMISTPTTKEKPAEITVTEKEVTINLLGTDCKECFNISMAVDFIKQQKTLKVKEVKELSIADSAELIEKYNLSKLPAVLITGDITNLTIPNFDQIEDALVFAKTPAPYYDVATKKIKGKVSVIVLEEPACTECFDVKLLLQQLEAAGVKIAEQKTVEAKSDEGKLLIANYKIGKVPTIIFSKDALDYDVITQVWDQVGTKESDGKLVLRTLNPPYINVSTGKTEGLVSLIVLSDKNCTECYNASVIKELFQQNINMQIKTEETVDVASTKGKMLAKKYAIDLIPTVLLSKEASAYPNFEVAWQAVGTQEKDGMFVFRSVPLIENAYKQQGKTFVYENLTSGEKITGNTTTEEAEIAQPQPEE